MKKIVKTLLLLCIVSSVIISCKKASLSGEGAGTFVSEEYIFNKATKAFTPTDLVEANITSPVGIRFIYCFLIRDNATDSLIYVTNNTEDNPLSYKLSIPIESFPLNNLTQVKGVKVLVKQKDNSSIEGFININFFDPSLPQFNSFPTSLVASLNAGTTSIKGNATSEFGLKQVDVYDDYQTENVFVLSKSFTVTGNAKEYALNYDYTYRKAAQHIKVVAKDIYNQTNELVIDMPVDVAIFKPKFLNFPATITPNQTGTTGVSGQITALVGLKRIDIYDDYKGEYILVSSINVSGAPTSYTFNYNYAYRKRAENVKIIAIDTDDLQSEKVIPLDVTYGSLVYRDVFMTAHTTGTNTIFIPETGATKGNCELNASEATMGFVYYGTSSGPSFYSPANTTNVAANFKCNGLGWVTANPSALRATKFRVLVQGANNGVDNIYTQYNANEIDVLDDALFTGNIPSSSTNKFDPTLTATTSIFNLTNAYLIAVKIPDIGASTYKNGLIRVKEATSTLGTSTIKFDIYIQK